MKTVEVFSYRLAINWKNRFAPWMSMPYIAIKGFPKDEETIRKVADRFNEALLELWGCPQEAVNISYEAVPPEEWDERMERGEIVQNREKMLIYGGKRTDQIDPQIKDKRSKLMIAQTEKSREKFCPLLSVKPFRCFSSAAKTEYMRARPEII